MCPFVWLTIFFSFLVGLCELAAGLTVKYSPEFVSIREDDHQQVSFLINDTLPSNSAQYYYDLQIIHPDIAEVRGNKTFHPRPGDGRVLLNDTFEIRGTFLGRTNVQFVRRVKGKQDVTNSNQMEVIVKRKQRLLSTIFTISVVTLVSLNYINMGCALDIDVVKAVLKKPIAPLVGFATQFICMPIISYFVGKWLLGDTNYLWLGLFTFGCSPGGGASNMWTVLLKGNLDLSITMTFISTLASTFMLPLWMHSLGRTIFNETATKVPTTNILSTIVSMSVFLGIGYLIQRKKPEIAKVCKKWLAPISIGMIIFIITFGTYANLYMFKLMNAKILLSTAITVWSGFLIGFIASTILGLPTVDRVAISIETGLQNTGIAIVLLGFSLTEPSKDIASVVPVAASIVTPIPLTAVMIYNKLRVWYKKRQELKHKVVTAETFNDDSSKTTSSNSSMTLIDETNQLSNGYKTY